MKERVYTLDDPSKAHEFFAAYRPHPPTGWWFRGQADSTWTLTPKAGRPEFILPKGRFLGRFRKWSRQALAYLPSLPDNDWERLAIAQHFGLATCLLDWTNNPLVALFFACSEREDTEGTVFCYEPPHYINEEILPLAEDYESPGAGFIPRAISPRILNQRAIFTVHLPVTTGVTVAQHPAWKDHATLARLRVPAACKHETLIMLDNYGINAATLFPDLDGLSRYVNWETRGIVSQRKKP